MNLMMLLEMASSGFGERTAVGAQGQGLTYEQLFQRSGAAATHFREAGIDRVSLVDVSSEALPIALFGSAWAGVGAGAAVVAEGRSNSASTSSIPDSSVATSSSASSTVAS